MEPFERVSGLEIAHHDLRFQRRSWRFERVGQLVLTIVLVLALLGLFADGPLSNASARDDATGLTVEYERFLRVGRSAVMEVSLPVSSVGDRPAIELAESSLDAFRIESIVPSPVEESTTERSARFSFAPGTRRVRFVVQPQTVGLHRADVEASGTVGLTQLVYP